MEIAMEIRYWNGLQSHDCDYLSTSEAKLKNIGLVYNT